MGNTLLTGPIMKPQDLVSALRKIPPRHMEDTCYRFSGADKDPTAVSPLEGRYNPAGRFEALYTSKARETCLAELERKTAGIKLRKKLKISSLKLKLRKVLDLTDPSVLKALRIGREHLTGGNWLLTQLIGTCAHGLGYEALVVPSAAGSGDNIVIFKDNLSSGSSITVLKTRDLN